MDNQSTIQGTANNYQKTGSNIFRPINPNSKPQNVVFIVSNPQTSGDAKKISELEKEVSELKKQLSEQKKSVTHDKNISEVENSKSEKVESVSAVEEKKSLTDEDVTNFTATLWKNNPVPKDEPEPTKDAVSNSFSLGKFQVVAARVRGKKHKHEGTNCDDWFETNEVEGIFISAVSDGAGSKSFSRIGSRIACQTAVKFLDVELKKMLQKNTNFKKNLGGDTQSRNFLDDAQILAGILHESILKARAAVVEEFESKKNNPAYTKVVGRSLQLSDFAATFLLTATIPLSDNEIFVMSCQIGDGMVVAFDSEKNFTSLGQADSGTFAGETDFLTSAAMSKIENLQHRTRVARKNFALILSMTDGVADDYENNEQKLFDDLLANKILSDTAPAAKLAKWLDTYTVRGSFDDRTLVAIRKRGVNYA